MITKEIRAKGCLLGLAVGDALGTSLEFTEPGSFQHVDDMMGGGPFDLKPGQWTDDTSMALCLAESLIEVGRFDLSDQARRYVSWWQNGHLSSTGHCFDIGNTVSAALSSFLQTGNAESGGINPTSAGNGSIMRLAPIPMFFNDPNKAIFYAGESSKSTHRTQVAVDACRYLAGVLHGLLHGTSKEEVLESFYSPLQHPWKKEDFHPEIAEVVSGSFKKRNPPNIRGSSYVVSSLEAALWSFYNSGSYREGALKAVNLGEDADTTGAVYGQLAGACYGASAIPKEWLECLYGREMIEEFSLKLIKMS